MNEYQTYNSQILLDLLAKSDEYAFTELYDRYWQKLFTIAYNRIREVQVAEDIVHDVFASLWEGRERNEIKSLENYLATAVKYMVLSKIKAKSKARVFRKSLQEAQVFEMPVENSLHYKHILEIVNTEVESLPEKCRLIFKYSRNEGMPVKQIARKLNLSPKTVENQLGKAIKQLKLATRTFLQIFI